MWQPSAGTCAKLLPLEALQTKDGVLIRPGDIDAVSDHSGISGWLGGYFSAVNQFDPATDGNIMKGLKPRDLINWVFSHCRANPSDTFEDAVNALYKVLARKAPAAVPAR